MSAHALQRIAERFPHLSPGAVLRRLRTDFDMGSAWTQEGREGSHVSRVCIGTDVLYPVRNASGGISTVLSPGMMWLDAAGGSMELKAGLDKGVYQLPAQDYHRDPAPTASLSSTIARKILKKSPRHAWTLHPRLNPAPIKQKDTTTFDVGRAVHRAVLGKGEDYVEIPGNLLGSNGSASTNGAKEFIAEARVAGKTPLKADVVEEVERMKSAVLSRLASMGIVFDPAHSELTAIAEVNGVFCRVMVDNASADPHAPIYDLKSTTDASPEAVIRAIMSYGYDVQEAHYRDTWKAATGHDRPFQFVFIEKEEPFEICVMDLSGAAHEMASKQAARARYLWHQHMKMNTWPGYPAKVQRLELPEWYFARVMEREALQETLATADPSRETLLRARQFQAPEGVKL